MTADGRVGALVGLWRFPVKSMRGERLEAAELTDQGLLGDRTYALLDVETGKVASAKSVKLFPRLLDCTATFIEAPRPGRGQPPVRITLVDGPTVISDSPEIDRTLSKYFQRDVRLVRSAPGDFAIYQHHPAAAGPVDKLGLAYFQAVGSPSPVPVGAFQDLAPMSVITTSTLTRLAELEPRSRFDLRRFRMNVIVETTGSGFAENDWVGREVALGDTARLRVALPDPRCAMTTLAQDELPADPEVLKALTVHSRIPIGEAGLYPCAGVYAQVASPGILRTGDRVCVMMTRAPRASV